MARSVPPAITPIYATETVNQDIIVYEGEIQLVQGKINVSGPGTVKVAWLPFPRLQFQLDIPDLVNMPDAKAEVTLVSLKTAMAVYITGKRTKVSIADGSGMQITGCAADRLLMGKSRPVAKVVLHVPNFWEYCSSVIRESGPDADKSARPGRVPLRSDEWKLILDPVPNLREIRESLDSESGYAITHVGVVEMNTGKPLTIEEAESLNLLLRYFFSFVRGFWVIPLMLSGLDETDQLIWTVPGDTRIDRWRPVISWFDKLYPESMSELFPGFIRRLQSETWGSAMKQAVFWYIQANDYSEVGSEGGIVLTQVALELLSWALLVEDTRVLTRRRFCRKLNADDRIRELLGKAQIDPAIPERLANLQAAGEAQSWKDGPYALTFIRNSIVHPNLQKRIDRTSHGLRFDAYMLGLWYLELVLLWLCEYHGSYGTRLIPGRLAGGVQRVPWAT